MKIFQRLRAERTAAPGTRVGSILPLCLNDVCYEIGGQRLIHRLDLVLEPGPLTVLMGPNGAGKSITLRLCHGLLQPTSGTVEWRGPTASAARRRQAFVFQRPVMLRRSARSNVEFALACHGVRRAERRTRAQSSLDRVGLADVAERPARVLSIGEQQRLALARSWALEPEVLFLDEPTASLDPAATRAIEDVIVAIKNGGTKVILTTHDLAQARRLADEVLFIHRGRLLESTSAEAFFTEPRSREAADFLEGTLVW